MKKDYILILLLLFVGYAYGQDKPVTTNVTNQTKEIKGFEIYPNPVSDGFLRINTFKNSERTVDIYDLLGKLVFFKTTTKNFINISKLKSGIYIIKVYEQGNSATRKLIIK